MQPILDLEITSQVPITFEKEKYYKALAPFFSFWKKLNQGQEFLGMADEIIKKGSSAIQIFFKEELNFALALLRSIHQRFANLNKICKGITYPNNEDMAVAMSLMNHEVFRHSSLIWHYEMIKSITINLNS